jgi:putative methanogenesis marker protein 17
MTQLEYFRIECPEPVGGAYYEKICDVVLLDHNLIRVIHKLHVFIDPGVPIFIAVGVIKKLPSLIRVRDFTDVNNQEGKVTISINNEAYLAPLLEKLWIAFGKDSVEQPDRFTIVMTVDPSDAEKLEDMIVTDPSEGIYKDLIYALQCIQPEGFKVRRLYHGKGKFWFVASEDTLPEDYMSLVNEKFALMGESL